MQPERGLELGRPLGSAFSVHPSWFPAGALLVAHLSLSAYNDRRLVSSVVLALVTVGGYFVCVVVHALAHVIGARLSGSRSGPSSVYVFGDVTPPHARAQHRSSVVVALSGPIASVALGGTALIASLVATGDASDVLRTLGFANVALAAVNLLPVLPLDGGRLVAAGGRTRARLASFGGKIFGVLAVAGGAWLLLQVPAPVQETAAGLWLVLVGVFVFIGSGWNDYRAESLPVVDGRTVGEWARPFVGRLDAAAPAPATGGPYAVADRGRLAGVLTESLLREGERAGDLMVPWTSDLGMPSDAPIVRALQRLSENGAPVVIVVDEEGVVRGVLDEGAVRERLATS